MPEATSRSWDTWNRGRKLASPGQTLGLTPGDVRRGVELDEAEERGRRRGCVQAGKDALAAARDASVLDRVRGGDHPGVGAQERHAAAGGGPTTTVAAGQRSGAREGADVTDISPRVRLRDPRGPGR
jgi:hypothetical protein